MIYIFCNLFFVFYYYKRDYFAPLMIFLIFQLIMYVGLIKIVDFNNSSDLKLIFLYFIALFGLIVGDQFVFMRNKKYVKMNYSKLNGTQGERIILLMIFYMVFHIALSPSYWDDANYRRDLGGS